ncbi:MAG TPA: DegT/DnrJ/EryC1/StrS family aminotransferase [Pirellulales bacterium]|nr:DegT/DnrJ/EryC1/StrS family aminotransferase [Pirellulales bacterium]
MHDPIVNSAAGRYIPVARPSLTALEADAVRACILAGWVSGGPKVREFEAAFAATHSRGHGVACNSGTTALHLALAALDIGPGDTVIVPTLTMVAVANAVLCCGAMPRFVDSEPATGNADWAQIVAACKSQAAKAVIVPHLYGVPLEFHPADVPLPVIEDCAESHFAAFSDGSPVGSRGRLATWSFYGNKIVTCGEGGLVATDEPRMAERLRSLRAHAFTPGNHFHHQELAYGYRMTEMAAAVGLAQYARRAELTSRRAAIFKRYVQRLQTADWLEFQSRTPGSAHWVMPVLADSEARRDAARWALASAGVETRTYFVPLPWQPHLRRFATQRYPVADDLSRRGMYLPLFPDMTDDDVDYVCQTLRQERSQESE